VESHSAAGRTRVDTPDALDGGRAVLAGLVALFVIVTLIHPRSRAGCSGRRDHDDGAGAHDYRHQYYNHNDADE